MRKWLGRSLKHKLSFMILVSILVPLLSLSFFSYKIASKLSEEKAKMSGMNILRQLDMNLEFMITDVENMSMFLIGHEGVQNHLLEQEQNAAQQSSVIGFLTNLAFTKKYIANITITSNNGKPPLSNTTIVQSGLLDITQQHPDYYEHQPKRWSSLHEILTSTGVKQVITLSRPIRSLNKFQTIGALAISLDQEVISRNLRRSGMVGDGYVLVLDENNRIISGYSDAWLYHPITQYFPNIAPMNDQSGFFNYGKGEEKKTILYYTVPNINWKLMGVIPFEEYSSQNQYVLALTAIAVGIAVLLVVGLVLFLIQKVTNPLLALTNFLKTSSPDEPIPQLPVTTIDEVGQLILNYNKLSNRIHKLTSQVMMNESLKKEADLLALQAQINPHFLYNTLASIHWMALMNKDFKIAEMVGALSDFLRFSLNKGEEYCSVQQEIAHVQNYVNIQSIRYPDKFDIRIYVHPDIKSKGMLKLLLQPLIENAMIHGIQKRDGKGTIDVHAELHGSEMIFTVRDDGVGMNAHKLEQLCSQLSENESAERTVLTRRSYGLRNVHRRLVLHYGNNAGLKIESKEGEGSVLWFTIPLLEEEETHEIVDCG